MAEDGIGEFHGSRTVSKESVAFEKRYKTLYVTFLRFILSKAHDIIYLFTGGTRF